MLEQVPDAGSLVGALSGALSLTSLFNYQHGAVDETSVHDVIDNARVLLDAAAERIEPQHGRAAKDEDARHHASGRDA